MLRLNATATLFGLIDTTANKALIRLALNPVLQCGLELNEAV
jgi:hypothetical protein